ncbi:hypothetical protein MBAV_003470 [Candidatus Magnetobacterium bavaricum]|uniref:Uncharacterized protein n=1 Tax=Candidatus Magnetobacterium bavaricum TaxID=29290 RepID=A0A0F3GR05_9BACT|nr:hypothetical protein MBAV_003470 [Candidatus Magnetobacterium bavaricum]
MSILNHSSLVVVKHFFLQPENFFINRQYRTEKHRSRCLQRLHNPVIETTGGMTLLITTCLY